MQHLPLTLIQNITFSGGTCSGGHGLSIGSVGGRDDNTVSNVLIEDSTVTNSDNGVSFASITLRLLLTRCEGIRIKTVFGATGKVTGVSYKNITLSTIAKVRTNPSSLPMPPNPSRKPQLFIALLSPVRDPLTSQPPPHSMASYSSKITRTALPLETPQLVSPLPTSPFPASLAQSHHLQKISISSVVAVAVRIGRGKTFPLPVVRRGLVRTCLKVHRVSG